MHWVLYIYIYIYQLAIINHIHSIKIVMHDCHTYEYLHLTCYVLTKNFSRQFDDVETKSYAGIPGIYLRKPRIIIRDSMSEVLDAKLNI